VRQSAPSRPGGATADRVQCLIPADLAPRLEPTLSRYASEHGLGVVVERRQADRRRGAERRDSVWPGGGSETTAGERRRVRNAAGRRVGERRATLIPVAAEHPLPRRAATYAERLVFVERLDLDGEILEDLDTARLVTRWQAGDREVFTELYQRYFDRVYTYLRLALKDSHEAEDGAQQVFISVMEALNRYQLGSVPVRGWLFRIVRNYAISHARRSGRTQLEDPETLDGRMEVSGDAEGSNVLEWLTDADLLVLVDRLPEPQRQVLALRYMLDLTFQEAAEVLDRTPDAVRQLHHRAIGALRSQLTALGRRSEARALRVPMRRRCRPTLESQRNRYALRFAPAR
jgi:RNA polymerase sigma-70 factor, ECF subfamily